jgi:hypothetical protein
VGELGRYYQDEGWGKSKAKKQEWILGFELYEKQNLIAEASWKHKHKLIDVVRQGDTKELWYLGYGIDKGMSILQARGVGEREKCRKAIEVSHT